MKLVEHDATPFRCRGGPLDGQTLSSTADVIVLAEDQAMAYFRTHDDPVGDPDWFIKGLPEPTPSEPYWEWRPRSL